MQRLEKEFAALHDYARKSTLFRPELSAWTIGMHVEHTAKVIHRISNALAASTSPAPKAKWSLARFFVLTSGRIPRGKGKAPEPTIPNHALSGEELLKMLDEAQRSVLIAEKVDRGCWFTHPRFGVLKRDQALRFVRIHTRHHLQIIKEIAQASS